MTFQLIFQAAVFVSIMVDQCGSLTFNCVSTRPNDQETLSCTCTNPTKNGVEWRKGTGLTTSCGGGINNDCLPSVTGYSSDVSKDEFYLQINPYTHTDCAIYSCKDAITGDETPITTSIAAFDISTITTAEPGAHTNGSISITTGCVFSPSDIKIRWFKLEGGALLDLANPVPSNDKSTCTRTCNSLEDQKVTSGFIHTEYNGSNAVEVQFMVNVSHSSYPSVQFTWTSEAYMIEGDCICECDCECRTIVIVSIVFGILGALGLLIIVVGIPAGWFNGRETLLLASGVIGIGSDVLSLVLSIVVKVKECCECCEENCEDSECCGEDSECCKDWIDNAAIAFIVIPCVAVIASVVIFVLVKLDVIRPGNDAYKAEEAKHPDENHGMTGTSM